MKYSSFEKDFVFAEEKVDVKLILETSFTKEIRILLKQGQIMKEHKTPFAIVIHLLKGEIEFGVDGVKTIITSGDILTLDGNVPHDLKALKESVVRLTLSKLDKEERVEDVAKA